MSAEIREDRLFGPEPADTRPQGTIQSVCDPRACLFPIDGGVPSLAPPARSGTRGEAIAVSYPRGRGPAAASRRTESLPSFHGPGCLSRPTPPTDPPPVPKPAARTRALAAASPLRGAGGGPRASRASLSRSMWRLQNGRGGPFAGRHPSRGGSGSVRRSGGTGPSFFAFLCRISGTIQGSSSPSLSLSLSLSLEGRARGKRGDVARSPSGRRRDLCRAGPSGTVSPPRGPK